LSGQVEPTEDGSPRRRRIPLWEWIVFGAGLLVVVLGSLAFASLFFDAVDEELIYPYRLFDPDSAEDAWIVYDPRGDGGTGRIRAVIVAVGWDTHYLVAARRQPGDPGGELFYYYIDMSKDQPGGIRVDEGVVVGPLTAEEFEIARASLSLPSFTVRYPELR